MFKREDIKNDELYLVKLDDETVTIGYYDDGRFFDEHGWEIEEVQISLIFPITLDQLLPAFIPLPKKEKKIKRSKKSRK